MSEGPLYWDHPIGPPGSLYMGGQLLTSIKSISRQDRDEFAALQGLLYGGTVFQTVPSKTEAPIDLEGDRFECEVSTRHEEQYSKVRRAIQLSRIAPVYGLVPWVVEDRWIIPATAKTTWIMSRYFSFSLVAYNAGITRTVPKCFIEAAPGATDATVPLTLVTSGLGAGEFLVDTAADGYSIDTSDLSGTYAGRVLCLRYIPKRLLRANPMQEDMPQVNEIAATMTIDEIVPARVYAT